MIFFDSQLHRFPNCKISDPLLDKKQIALHIKREDLIHPFVSGNKFRKLKYNIKFAIDNGLDTILTFGGAYSNHIVATAAAGKLCNLKTIGVIRGEELGKDLQSTLASNPSLRIAWQQGMRFVFVSRERYREKSNPDFIKQLQAEFGKFYLIPEGGTNDLAIQGCEEILTSVDTEFDVICTPVGTAGTMLGLLNSAKKHQTIIGYAALQGTFLDSRLEYLIANKKGVLTNAYSFGGYAKINASLVAFSNEFREKHGILLDPIYTAKMIYGIFDQIRAGYFRNNTKILAIHTGGTQAIPGMNNRLKKKNKTLISC